MSFNLKQFRIDVGLTQDEVAGILGCKQSYISVVERLNKDLTQEHADKLSQIYGSDKVLKYHTPNSAISPHSDRLSLLEEEIKRHEMRIALLEKIILERK